MTLRPHRAALWLSGLLLLAVLIALFAMDRPPICACGTVKLWHGVVQSSENSQHIADWYTPSHIIHGFLFFGLGWLITRRWPGFAPWALPLALLIEGGWEVLENTPMVIDRYRTVTVSWGYTGDSILNSMADIGWMALGFVLAARVRWTIIVPIAIAAELFTGIIVRDNLTLNVLMLVHPIPAVAAWQAGG